MYNAFSGFTSANPNVCCWDIAKVKTIEKNISRCLLFNINITDKNVIKGAKPSRISSRKPSLKLSMKLNLTPYMKGNSKPSTILSTKPSS